VSSPGAALTRVTLVAARADDNVVLLQADYFPDQAASEGTLLPALAPALDPPPDSHDGAIARASPRPRTLALYYARTQGSSGEARLGAYIDVHA
jgi:hypothetical protein